MTGTAADIDFILKQIDICSRLAKACRDPEIAAGLIKLKQAFADRAAALAADARPIPRFESAV